MKVVCIGAGRLAQHLMPELQRAGCDIIQVYNRTDYSAQLLSQKLNDASVLSDINQIAKDADIYFITLSDDAIYSVSILLQLQDINGIVVHCSGAAEYDILPFPKKGVFYPLQTFSGVHKVDWTTIPIIITSDSEEVVSKLETLARKISSTVVEMTDTQKSALHLAAVFANNFTNHILSLAGNICARHNVPFEILKPLIQTTIDNALEHGPSESQTGPAIRGDDRTIEKHVQMLDTHPEILEVYKVITKSIEKG